MHEEVVGGAVGGAAGEAVGGGVVVGSSSIQLSHATGQASSARNPMLSCQPHRIVGLSATYAQLCSVLNFPCQSGSSKHEEVVSEVGGAVGGSVGGTVGGTVAVGAGGGVGGGVVVGSSPPSDSQALIN